MPSCASSHWPVGTPIPSGRVSTASGSPAHAHRPRPCARDPTALGSAPTRLACSPHRIRRSRGTAMLHLVPSEATVEKSEAALGQSEGAGSLVGEIGSSPIGDIGSLVGGRRYWSGRSVHQSETLVHLSEGAGTGRGDGFTCRRAQVAWSGRWVHLPDGAQTVARGPCGRWLRSAAASLDFHRKNKPSQECSLGRTG
jgi:hypothetical protein